MDWYNNWLFSFVAEFEGTGNINIPFFKTFVRFMFQFTGKRLPMGKSGGIRPVHQLPPFEEFIKS